jgi:hypothetical protein
VFYVIFFVALSLFCGTGEPGQRSRRGDNIEMVLREIGWDGMYWIDLAQDRDQWRPL